MAKQNDLNPMGFTPAKAADKLSLSTTLVRKLITSGDIPAVKVGKRWIIPVRALEQWLEQKTREANGNE